MSSLSDPRTEVIDAFLASAGDGWGQARRQPLGQDASTRRYIRLFRADGQTALLMDAPRVESDPCPPDANAATRLKMGWNAMTRLAASRVEAFALISDHLRSLGLKAPNVLRFDPVAGLALIEDFGDSREFARLIERGEAQETPLYIAAAERLAKLHAAPVPKSLSKDGIVWPILEFDNVALAANADLYADWLPAEIGQGPLDGAARARWEAERDGLIAQAMAFPRAFTLRDYHAENLLWLPDGEVGLLDFQDAVLGWDAWDLAMLTQDARRNVSNEAAEAAIGRFLDLTGQGRTEFDERLAVIGALNALRIAGVFSRLQHRDGKRRYADFQPRQLQLLARNLSHPALGGMAAFVRETTPFVFEGKV
ncbi:phosphotransferase [Hyphomonas sp.]|uniref:aminoglycoside phosphotransferase family protein n=1 Tax=Hyphomonas sp. TaxID=87 RepID=UPI0025B8481C|nr:phosphotransferase [Hyphomonas sp.]MBI1401041.1 phosphotransferase [Hyphomonas sp.]